MTLDGAYVNGGREANDAHVTGVTGVAGLREDTGGAQVVREWLACRRGGSGAVARGRLGNLRPLTHT